MRVLVGCEFSAVVRDAFRARGHDAYSVDLRPTDGDPRWHYQTDVFDVLELLGGFDLAIFHPPCTDLATSGARWFHLPEKQEKQKLALAFVRRLMACDVKRWALENPSSVISTQIRKPNQIIQPWQFGHPEKKGIWLWTQNLPPLIGTEDVSEAMALLPIQQQNRVHHVVKGPDRDKERSRFFPGIAAAMADQWGSL